MHHFSLWFGMYTRFDFFVIEGATLALIVELSTESGNGSSESLKATLKAIKSNASNDVNLDQYMYSMINMYFFHFSDRKPSCRGFPDDSSSATVDKSYGNNWKVHVNNVNRTPVVGKSFTATCKRLLLKNHRVYPFKPHHTLCEYFLVIIVTVSINRRKTRTFVKLWRFKVVVNTVMQIGPSIAVYGGIVFVSYLSLLLLSLLFGLFVCWLSGLLFVLICFVSYFPLDFILHVCNTWHGIISWQN